MSCGCNQTDDDAQHKTDELLEGAGLREIVEQGHSALAAASTALNHLTRAERAHILGFGDDVARMHRDAATRHNRRACEQLEFLIQRIDARKQADDWADIVKQAEIGFLEHGGQERFHDLRADVRMHLLEQEPGLSAAVSEQALALFDRAAESAKLGNLTTVLDFMQENCQVALEGFASEGMGRQPASQGFYLTDGDPPPVAGGQDVNGWCVALAACLAWANASLIATLLWCGAVPFCFCCFAGAVWLTYIGHWNLCFIAFVQTGACSV
jgi:hypothetical protein